MTLHKFIQYTVYTVPEAYINQTTSDNLSILAAEMLAIVFALQWIEVKPHKVVICSDSMSSLVSSADKIY